LRVQAIDLEQRFDPDQRGAAAPCSKATFALAPLRVLA
jgi:hypothetical protein